MDTLAGGNPLHRAAPLLPPALLGSSGHRVLHRVTVCAWGHDWPCPCCCCFLFPGLAKNVGKWKGGHRKCLLPSEDSSSCKCRELGEGRGPVESCPPAKANPQSQPGRQKGSFSLILVHCEYPGRETKGLHTLLPLLPWALWRAVFSFHCLKWGLLKSRLSGDPAPLSSHLCFWSLSQSSVVCPVPPMASSLGSRPSGHQKRALRVPTYKHALRLYPSDQHQRCVLVV